jgi:hypothetical protein
LIDGRRFEVSRLMQNPKFLHGVDDEREQVTKGRTVKLAVNVEKECENQETT